MRVLFTIFSILFFAFNGFAQFSITKGNDNFQIGLRSCTYYNYRFYEPEAINLKKIDLNYAICR
jgi:hypothetical protein